MIEVFTFFNRNDPLEQFLLINLFPGCPINNGDSSILVILLTSTALWYLFFINTLSDVGFYRYLATTPNILSYLNKKNNIFLAYLLNRCLGYVSIVLKKKISTIIYILPRYILLIFTNVWIKNFIEIFISNVIKFVASIVKENLFVRKHLFFTIYYFSFLIILFFNVLGLLPNSVTATSSFVLILNYSFSILVGLSFLGAYIHLSKYFNQFLPEGVPLFIAPVLALIELFSSIIRIFSLTVRLFANILAGHSLLKIIVTVSWSLISIFIISIPIALFIWLLLTPIFALECIIAFLQAYVYVLLLVIYTNDSINIH